MTGWRHRYRASRRRLREIEAERRKDDWMRLAATGWLDWIETQKTAISRLDSDYASV